MTREERDQIQRSLGVLHDAQAIASAQAREYSDRWTPDMVRRWQLFAWVIAETIDAADRELHAETERDPARKMIEGVEG